MIYIGNLTDAIIAFPSTSVSALSTVRVQIPAGYDLLEIQTLQGYYVLRLPMTDTIATFTAVTGAYYLFSATDYDTNSTITTVKQVISDVITLVPSNITPSVSIEEGEQLYYEYNPGTNDAVVVYTAPSPKNITMNYVLYDNKGNAVTNVTYAYSDVQMKVWHFSFPREFYKAVVTVTSDTYSDSAVIGGRLAGEQWFNEDLLPEGLILILAGLVGVFALKRENANYAPLILLTLLLLLRAIGFVEIGVGTITALVVLGVIGMYMSREG